MPNLLVTAYLSNALAGGSPRLDALVEYAMSLYDPGAIPGHKIARDGPPPPTLPSPIPRENLGGFPVPRCSDPILGVLRAETVEHVAKKLGVEDAGLLAPSSRLVVSTTNTWTKSYRLPLRKRLVDRVAWFCVGNRKKIAHIVNRFQFIGKKIALGNGRVARWEVEEVEDDHSWFATSPDGPILMRTLPAGPWLPDDLIGYRPDFAGCCPPYWHLSRRTEVVVPC